MAVTTLNEIRWRLWIGPHYSDYTWGIAVGNALFGTQPTSTLASTQASGASALVLTNGANFSPTGGVWVGGNAAGEGWEYESYSAKVTNTLTIASRESASDRDHNGIHTIGATAHLYYPLTSNDGNLSITEDADENASSVAYQASVSGVLAPHFVMRDGHLVVVESSTNGGSYVVALVGFLANANVTDNSQSAAEWSFNIMSSAYLLSVPADGVRAGDNVLDASGSNSTELVLAFDERPSGDYTKADPDFSATSVTDGIDETLFIAERYKGDDIWVPTWNNDPENSYSNGSGVRFSQVYINPPTTAGPGARWIEIAIGTGTSNHSGYAIYHANGGSSVEWQYGGPGTVATGDRILLVEDEATFTRLNPLASTAAIYEDATFFDTIDPTGSELWIRLGELNQWNCRMRWGHGDGFVQHVDAPSRTWVGATIAAPAEGETMRYRFDITTGDAADYWETGMVRHAGYDLDVTEPEYVMITFPGFGLTLTNAITAVSPANGENLYISGPDGEPSTDGLSSNGTLVFGDEQVTYSTKNDVGGYVVVAERGANGSTAAIHNVGDEVFVLDGGIVTDAYALKEIGWKRYFGTIYPKVFKIYTTNIIDNVRTPGTSEYLTDWTLRDSVTTHATSTYSFSLSTVRVRHLLLEIYEMTSKPARPRVNEVYGIMDPTYHNTGLWLATNSTVDQMIVQIVGNLGFPSNMVVVADILPSLDDIQTQSGGDAWTVITDLAEFTGSQVIVGRDAKLYLYVNDFWSGILSTSLTWSRSNTEQIRLSSQSTQHVAQVVLPWRTANGETTGTVYYPTTPGTGAKLELNETIYASESAAITATRRLYYMRRYPVEFVVNTAIDASAYRPLVAHGIDWQFNLDHVALTRNCIVLGTNHTLNRGHWTSELRLLQYGHESNFI